MYDIDVGTAMPLDGKAWEHNPPHVLGTSTFRTSDYSVTHITIPESKYAPRSSDGEE